MKSAKTAICFLCIAYLSTLQVFSVDVSDKVWNYGKIIPCLTADSSTVLIGLKIDFRLVGDELTLERARQSASYLELEIQGMLSLINMAAVRPVEYLIDTMLLEEVLSVANSEDPCLPFYRDLRRQILVGELAEKIEIMTIKIEIVD